MTQQCRRQIRPLILGAAKPVEGALQMLPVSAGVIALRIQHILDNQTYIQRSPESVTPWKSQQFDEFHVIIWLFRFPDNPGQFLENPL